VVAARRRMSALGHKQTFCDAGPMSALPPIADIDRRLGNVRFVPIADIQTATGYDAAADNRRRLSIEFFSSTSGGTSLLDQDVCSAVQRIELRIKIADMARVYLP
jgi:hypothetical protein